MQGRLCYIGVLRYFAWLTRGDIELPKLRQAVTHETFTFDLNRQKLRRARRGEGTYLPRYTQPEKELQLLLHQLKLTLPDQPPPRLEELKKKCGADL